MIITLPGWAGRFDVDIDCKPGMPACFGPNGGDPGDPDQIELELIVWEFSPHDCIVLSPRQCGAELYQALLDYAYQNVDASYFTYDDHEFFDGNER